MCVCVCVCVCGQVCVCTRDELAIELQIANALNYLPFASMTLESWMVEFGISTSLELC